MESSEGGDDQGSGWLQVKKKHRSSSKFSVHGWVGGLSAKQSSRHPKSQPSVNVKFNNSSYVGQPSEASRQSFITDPGASDKYSCLKAGVAHKQSQGVDCYDSPTKNPDVLPKIKWGDLDDRTFLLHQENTAGSEIKFGRTASPTLDCTKYQNADNSILCSSSSDHKENNLIEINLVENLLISSSSLLPRTKSLANNCQDVSQVFSEDVKAQISNDKVVDSNGSVSDSCEHARKKQVKNLDTCTQFIENLSSATTDMNLAPAVGCEAGYSEVTELSAIDGSSNMVVMIPEECRPGTTNTHSLSRGKNSCLCTEEALTIPELAITHEPGSKISKDDVNDTHSNMVFPEDSQSLQPETTEESIVVTSVGNFECQPVDVVLNDLKKAQIVDHIDENGDESKERFRERLWCFLFENLNRAIDELYLLCELECDLEQMKEAILVLEEAASDFRELNSRVEDFEKVRKSSSDILDGAPLTMKSDHRRPHALSWEVRRMTTSPRRAEILSSSLEAFRKIQQERARTRVGDVATMGTEFHSSYYRSSDVMEKNNGEIDINDDRKSVLKPRKQHGISDLSQGNSSKEKKNINSNRCGSNGYRLTLKEDSTGAVSGKNKGDLLGAPSETDKLLPKKDKTLHENMADKNSKQVHTPKRQIPFYEREKEKRNGNLWKSMDAWKEKRNWEEILGPPHRPSSRFSHSPGMSRKSVERARVLHDKLMSPEKKKKSVLDLKKEAEEKHARATRIRNELESERIQRLQRTSEKLNRVNEFQAERSMKLREVMYARHQRSESRHEAFLAQVVRRANDESSKVNEVRFITSLNEENKKLILRQKLHDSELRRAEKLQLLKTKQKEDMAREEAVLERKKLLEAEKLQRLAETQRKKEEAQVRREEERKASSAAREAKAMEQMRRKEVRAKAQQEEAELLAQKLAERLSESEQRRKFYLEQIRERASMDFRDQTSPFFRRSANKENHGRSTSNNNNEDLQANNSCDSVNSTLRTGNMTSQHSLKRRIKRIRQKLMALKHEFSETSVGAEVTGIGYRTAVGTARAKIGRWLQELQKLRQARKEGAGSFGLVTAEMIKFLEGKDAELQASRQTGLLDFIASALPASHTSKPEACQVTLCLLRLLRVVLTMPANQSYFLSQNLLPPIIPMLAAALENYIKIAASANVPGSTSLISSKSSNGNLDSICEILDGFLWTVATIIGHVSSEECQIQMQDGLLDLVIAYQVIHRLRDLFALYDRPHTEGSPFPSSILLSINLLAVLTSRFRKGSSIDWYSFPEEIMCLNQSAEVKAAEFVDLIGLPDVPEDRPLDELINNGGSSTKTDDCGAVESVNTKTEIPDGEDESPSILFSITKCPVSLKEDYKPANSVPEQKEEVKSDMKQPVAFLLSAISETGLVCLPSMLTAVLLQANNKLSSEQVSYVLPSNFEEVATGVLKVLNNLALMDVAFIQSMLARPDLKMEFFHLMSFLLSHCTSKWAVATDQTGQLLLESLSLLGYFSLFHPENQAVLRWGKSPTILHKVCDLPFAFFSDPELMPILAGTMVAACFGCEQNKSVVLQELSMDMLLSLLKSCRNNSPEVQPISLLDPTSDEAGESNQFGPECRKPQVDTLYPQKSQRHSMRNARTLSQKGAAATNVKTIKMRNQREKQVTKLSEETGQKLCQYTCETSALMLHCRFPGSFMDRAEQFFSREFTNEHI
ncbi:hypothetical protein ACH5RR_025815 [Cinchona calisaya]|uniref:S phase cyclin A-associated protein in the endoplasmic reticulum N-terminal domain-containing protein n=1 Tax=Cinchona calisaya TaxID=153742 RepID=A0ABD2Z1V5_9GENT